MASSAIRIMTSGIIDEQAMGLLDEVRSTTRSIAQSARYVRVQTEAIATYAAGLPLEVAQTPALDAATHHLGAPEATLAFVVTLDAINFGSGYFPKLKKRPG